MTVAATASGRYARSWDQCDQQSRGDSARMGTAPAAGHPNGRGRWTLHVQTTGHPSTHSPSMDDVRRFILAAFVALGVATVGAKYRSWHLRWGATDDEVHGPMPGDDLLDGDAFTATRAVSIAAPPERVWPWLLQVGFGRAGFYSYDLLDNLGRPSADEILPGFASVAPGDLAAPMASPANDQNSFVVAEAHEPSVLVWSKPDSTWAWRLTADDAGGTRLVTRLKARYELGPFLPVRAEAGPPARRG